MILELASIPLADKLNLHKAIGEMLHTEVLKHILALEKVERKLTKMSNTLKRERANEKSLSSQLADYKKMIRGKGTHPNAKMLTLLQKTELEVQEL